MPHPDKKNSASESNYLAILGHQVLRLFENIKSLILQTLSVDFLSDSFLHLLLYRTGYIIIVRSCWGFFKQGGCIGPRMFNWESNPAYAIPPLLYSLYHQCCSASQSTGVAKNQNINSNKTTQNKTKKPQTKQIKIKKKNIKIPTKNPNTLFITLPPNPEKIVNTAASQMFHFISTLRSTCCSIQFFTLQKGSTAMSYLEHLPLYLHAWTGSTELIPIPSSGSEICWKHQSQHLFGKPHEQGPNKLHKFQFRSF